jgi:hypothetical protein
VIGNGCKPFARFGQKNRVSLFNPMSLSFSSRASGRSISWHYNSACENCVAARTALREISRAPLSVTRSADLLKDDGYLSVELDLDAQEPARFSENFFNLFGRRETQC